MTSYITITDAETDPEAPLTSELAKKWRDNPIAIAEADSTVPAGLLPTVHLGTLTTTSGTTQTLSGLVLTPYKFLRLVWNGVSHNWSSNQSFAVNGITVTSGISLNSAVSGGIDIDLNNEVSVVSLNFAIATAQDLNINNSTTSISVSVSVGSFDAGSIRFYGAK